MLQRRTGWIGIDIGSRSIKVAQVERDPLGGLRLRQAAIIARRVPWPDADTDSSTPPQESASEILAALDFGEHFRGRRAACTLPMHIFRFRGMHIPQGTPSERRTMVAAALEDAWDDTNPSCELDFWETDIPGTKLRQDEPNVNALALARNWARQVTEDAKRANIALQVLDGPPLAVSRAVALASHARPSSTMAAIDWGFTSTTFCVVKAGRALFTRRVRSCGLRLICEAVQSSLGVTLEEAQHLLIKFGLPHDGERDRQQRSVQEALASAAAESLGRLTEEIRRTLTYFSAQRRDLIPARIWLVGGGAGIRNASSWLTHACGLSVDLWSLDQGNSQAQRETTVPAGKEPLVISEPLIAGAIALSSLPL